MTKCIVQMHQLYFDENPTEAKQAVELVKFCPTMYVAGHKKMIQTLRGEAWFQRCSTGLMCHRCSCAVPYFTSTKFYSWHTGNRSTRKWKRHLKHFATGVRKDEQSRACSFVFDTKEATSSNGTSLAQYQGILTLDFDTLLRTHPLLTTINRKGDKLLRSVLGCFPPEGSGEGGHWEDIAATRKITDGKEWIRQILRELRSRAGGISCCSLDRCVVTERVWFFKKWSSKLSPLGGFVLSGIGRTNDFLPFRERLDLSVNRGRAVCRRSLTQHVAPSQKTFKNSKCGLHQPRWTRQRSHSSMAISDESELGCIVCACDPDRLTIPHDDDNFSVMGAARFGRGRTLRTRSRSGVYQ